MSAPRAPAADTTEAWYLTTCGGLSLVIPCALSQVPHGWSDPWLIVLATFHGVAGAACLFVARRRFAAARAG